MSEDFDLDRILEEISPSSLAAHLDPSRPYDGQPHTDHGDRGRTEVKGSGLPIEEWPGSVYDLPWDDMDIIAVAQNLSCNVEKAMGIYPNVPRRLPADPTEPHWCGWPIDRAEWMWHDSKCPESGEPHPSGKPGPT